MIDFHKNGSYGASNADLSYAKAHGKFNLLSLYLASFLKKKTNRRIKINIYTSKY
jgi:hypothetical protein